MEQPCPNVSEHYVAQSRDPQARQEEWGLANGFLPIKGMACYDLHERILNGPLRQTSVVDHESFWTDGERALILLEPYNLTDERVAECVRIADTYGWHVDTTLRKSSVWYPGRTQMLILWCPLDRAWLTPANQA